MTRNEIEHMWKVASNNPNHDTNWHDPVVEAFAKLVAAAAASKERKEICGTVQQIVPITSWAHELLDAIRARGEA